jgi:hypothetical protein
MVGPNTFMTKLIGLFTRMDTMVGKDFEPGLDQLSAYLRS